MEEATFFSANILSKVAFDAARESAAKSDANLIAALFSALWLEASLNEIVYDLTIAKTETLDAKLHEAQRAVVAADLFERTSASVRDKLSVLCAATTKGQLNWGVAPWQGVTLLLQVRNWLAHLRPERMKVRLGTDSEPSTIVSREVHSLVVGLKAAGAIHVPQGRVVSVAIATSLPGVGAWSYRTAYEALVAVATWYPDWRRDLLSFAHEPIAPQTAV